jgi:hypothetical protein
MDGRCKGCIQHKGALVCILVEVVEVRPDLVDCPCAVCLVKVICDRQCDKRITYFLKNIDRIQEGVGELQIQVGNMLR